MSQKFEIILGCFGKEDGGFISCPSVENTILIVDPLMHKYKELILHLKSFNLFEKRLLDYNAIRHFIFNLQNNFDQITKKIWTERQFLLLQKFTISHKDCGLYIDVIQMENDNEE